MSRRRIIPKNGRVFARTPPDIEAAAGAYLAACDAIAEAGNLKAAARAARRVYRRLEAMLPRQVGYHPVAGRLIGYWGTRAEPMRVVVAPGSSGLPRKPKRRRRLKPEAETVYPRLSM